MKKADSWCLFFSTFSNLRLIFDFHYSPLSFMIQHFISYIWDVQCVNVNIPPSSCHHNVIIWAVFAHQIKNVTLILRRQLPYVCLLRDLLFFFYIHTSEVIYIKRGIICRKTKLWPAWTDGKTPAIDWGQCAEYYAFITSLHLQTGGESNVAHANHAPVPMSAHLGVLLCCSANTVWLAVFGGLRVGGGVSIY